MIPELRKKNITLEYITDKFQQAFEIERNELDKASNEWKSHMEQREALTQIEAKISLTERCSLPDEPWQTKEWYGFRVCHCDDLSPDGTYTMFPPREWDITGTPYDTQDKDRNMGPEIEQMIKKAIPDYNVSVQLKIHSAVTYCVQGRDYNCITHIFRPLIREIVGYLVQQAVNEIGTTQKMIMEQDVCIEEFCRRIKETYEGNNHVYRVEVGFSDGSRPLKMNFITPQGFEQHQNQRKGTIELLV